MKQSSVNWRHAAKTTLCAALVVNLHVWNAGCGVTGPIPLSDGWVRVPLDAGSALKSALRGTRLEAVSALEVNAATGHFRMALADTGGSVRGTFGWIDGSPVVSSIEFTQGDVSAAFEFDSLKRITLATTSTGTAWLPDSLDSPLLFGPGASGVDAYIAANATLCSRTRATPAPSLGGGGTGGGSSGGGTVPPFQSGAKAIAASQEIPNEIAGVLGVLGFVLALQAGAAMWPALYFVFQVVVAVNLTMSIFGTNGSSGGSGTGSSSTITGDATVRVINNRTDGVPIWYVVLVQDPVTGAPGSNLLGDEGIPAGSFRDFAVPPGVRTFNLVSPNGAECYEIFERAGVTLTSNVITEISLLETDPGRNYPDGCIPN